MTILLSLCLPPAAEDANLRRARTVRVLHPSLRNILGAARRDSGTLQSILNELEHSDLIVHVIGAEQYPGTTRVGVDARGAMQFIGVAGRRRFVRVTVDESLDDEMLAGVLAHELYHALEVSRAHRS